MQALCVVLIVFALALPVLAEDGQGWTFSGRLQGSSNTDGLVMKADPTLGYAFGPHVETYAGVPFYFVNGSSTATQTTSGFVSGVGNAYAGVRFSIKSEAVNYASTIEGAAPTGDKSKGLSTGRATVDWTNTISHKVNRLTPFASAGLANTVSDTSLFVRPFTSLGFVTHFDGGLAVDVAPLVRVGASAYGIQAAGQQRIFSKIKGSGSSTSGATGTSNGNRVFENNSETVGTSDLANDHGVSTWVAVHAGPYANLQVGYTRSMGYDLNTLSFGIGFRVPK
jgi:hypothetical protein